MILWLGSGAERLEVVGLVQLDSGGGVAAGAGDEGDAGTGQNVEAEVAAAFGPFVVLLGRNRTDETDQGVTGGEDPGDIGPPADFTVSAVPADCGPHLPPDLLREACEREHIGMGGVQVRGDLGVRRWGERASARQAGIPWLAAHAGCYLVAPLLAAVPFPVPSSGLAASSRLSANFRWDLVASSRLSVNFRWEMSICSAKS